MIDEPLDLNLDLNSVDTSFPVLKAGTKDLEIVSMSKEENKSKLGFNLKVTFATVDPDTDTNDRDVKPGHKLNRWFPLQGTGKPDADPEQYKKGLAELQDAALGTSQGSRPAFTPRDLIGKRVRANVKVGKDDNDRPSNEIKSLTHPV